jgi:Raf kinase inhibitor-like YbhB/YbcL family protein
MPNGMLSMARDETRSSRTLAVMSSTIHGEIPAAQSEYAGGISPEISWTAVEGAKSYALILEDPDAPSPQPFVHWMAYNIPANVTEIPQGIMKNAPRPSGDGGFLQGKTSKGNLGYFGPRPPEGDSAHHYHFQVFALDAELDVPAGAERDELLSAMDGHVLASGELVGTFQQVKTDQRIGAEGTEAPGEPRRTGEAHLADDQEQRDAALANTFPASDPVPAKHIDDGTSPRRRSR